MTAWINGGHATLWQVGERGLRACVSLALVALIARTLGPSDFGLYNYALATIALFAFLGQAGLDALLLRELVRFPERAESLLSSALLLRTLGALFAGAASVAIALLAASNDMREAATLVAILAVAGVLQSSWIADTWLQANRILIPSSKAKIVVFAISTGLRLSALQLPDPIFALASVSLAEALIAGTVFWQLSKRLTGVGISSIGRPERSAALKLARVAMPLLLSAFAIALYSRIDIFILGRVLGSEQTGWYMAALIISEGFYVIPIAVVAVASPHLAKLHASNKASFMRELQNLLRILSAAGFALALLTATFAPAIISMLFGDNYAAATPALSIRIWSTWAVFISAASDLFYINEDLRTEYLIKTGVTAASNLLLNAALIPDFGIRGAATATAISYFLSAIFLGACFKATRPLFIMQMRAILLIAPSKHIGASG